MRVYHTEQGDTWDFIARKVYGSELLIPPLLEANTALLDVVVFSSGQAIAVPDLPARYRAGNQAPLWRRLP